LFVALLGAGLLTHQFMYVIMYRRYLTINFAPALGVLLPDRLFVLVQVTAIPLVIVLLSVGGTAATLAALAVYSLWASVQSMRISNHVWLAFLGIALVGLSDPDSRVTVARLLLGALYLVSGLVKCNNEFLFSEQSAARVIITMQATNGNWRAPRILLALSPYVVAFAEVAVGVLLLAGVQLVLAFAVCAVLHFTFGFVGNVHFSLIALAFWSVALGCRLPDAAVLGANWAVLLAVTAFGAATSYLLKANLRDFIDPSSTAGLVGSAVLNGLYCPAAVLVWLAIPDGELPAGAWGIGPAVAAVAMTANFVLLLAGLKSEWSYAMFSNVKPYGGARIFGFAPRWRARYYAVEWVGELPEETRRLIPEHTREQLEAGSHVFSGPVVRELARIAERTGHRIEVSPVSFDGETTVAAGPGGEAAARRGPLWVAPSITRRAATAHLG